MTLKVESDSPKVKPVGRDIKLDLFFLDKWILISEVTFKTSDVNATLVGVEKGEFEFRAVTLFTFWIKEYERIFIPFFCWSMKGKSVPNLRNP